MTNFERLLFLKQAIRYEKNVAENNVERACEYSLRPKLWTKSCFMI